MAGHRNDVGAARAALDDTDREAAIATIRSEAVELANLVSELVDLSTDRHTAEPLVWWRPTHHG